MFVFVFIFTLSIHKATIFSRKWFNFFFVLSIYLSRKCPLVIMFLNIVTLDYNVPQLFGPSIMMFFYNYNMDR